LGDSLLGGADADARWALMFCAAMTLPALATRTQLEQAVQSALSAAMKGRDAVNVDMSNHITHWLRRHV
jgi:hypothetical protein